MAEKYLTTFVGLSKNEPYAFHMEGYLTKDPNVKVSEDGTTYASDSMGIHKNIYELINYAKEGFITAQDNGEFVSLDFSGKIAEIFAKDAVKGMKIAVCGNFKKYTDKNGVERPAIKVKNFVLLPQENGQCSKRISQAPREYVYKDQERAENDVTLLTGRVIRVNEVQTSGTGTTYLNCGLGLNMPAERVFDVVSGVKVKDKTYEEDANTIVNMTFFGKAAEAKSKILRKGMLIAVSGKMTVSEYEERTSYTVFPSALSVIDWANKEENPEATKPQEELHTEESTAPAGAVDEDEDDEVPF